MIANYHTHTARCGHAGGEDREYVEAAIKAGFKTLGFSEHAPMHFPTDIPENNLRRLLSMRMKTHEMDGYIESVLSLREEYKNDIDILVGFEAEYFEPFFDEFIEYISDYPIDYLILGQHFGTPYDENMIHNGVQTSKEQILKDYVDTVVKGISTGKFSYVAHPDLMFGKYPEFDDTAKYLSRELCREANRLHIPLEYNLYGVLKGAPEGCLGYPYQGFWEIAAEENCTTVIGVDAHKPEQLIKADLGKFRTMLESLGLKITEDPTAL